MSLSTDERVYNLENEIIGGFVSHVTLGRKMESCYSQRCVVKPQGFPEEQPRMGLVVLG